MGILNKVAKDILRDMRIITAKEDADDEWKRVNTYLADSLKDAHVLYAKLARLQTDFGGEESKALTTIADRVLEIGGELANFSRSFNEGKIDMSRDIVYGEEPESGGSSFSSEPSLDSESLGLDSSESSKDESGDSPDVDMEFDYSGDSDEDSKKSDKD